MSVAKLTLSRLENLLMPKVNEQLMANEKLAAVESRVHSEQELLSKLQRQKLGLMQDLLTGRVPVKVDTKDKEAVA